MKTWFFILAFVTSAFAQQPQPQSTALDRMSQSFGICVGSLENVKDEMGRLQQENAKLKAEIEELKKPKEPAK